MSTVTKRIKDVSKSKSAKKNREIIVMLPALSNETGKRISNITNSDTDYTKDNLSISGSIKDNLSERCDDSLGETSDNSDVDTSEKSKCRLYEERRSALEELVTTEKNYIDDLAKIVQGYMELIKKDDIPKPPTLVGKELIVFGNIHQIYEWHKNTFHPEMEKCINIPQKLGTVFTRFEKRFHMYVKYCENKPKSEDKVYENLDYFEKLREKLDHKLQLADMLIKPVQRVMKYELLLKAILKYTEKAGEDVKDIQRAIEVMCIIPRAANDMMNVGRLQGFNGKVTAQGLLLLQDTLEVAEHSSAKAAIDKIIFHQKRTFLFEQIVIFSKLPDRKKKSRNVGLHYLYSNCVRVNKMAMESEIKDHPCHFRLIDKTPGIDVRYTCQCKDENSKKNWVTQIKLLLDMQNDFLRALQLPITYQNDLSKVNADDLNDSINQSDDKQMPSKKPPKSGKGKRNTSSFRNLFLRTSNQNGPSSPNTRKHSLGFLDVSGQKTADANFDMSKVKWPFFSSLGRKKTSEVSLLSSPGSNDERMSIISTDSEKRASHHMSCEDILDFTGKKNKKRSSAKRQTNKSDDECNDEESENGSSRTSSVSSTPQPKTAGIGWVTSRFLRRPSLFMLQETEKQIKVPECNIPEVKLEPLFFIKNLEDVTANEGSTISLRCRLPSSPNPHSIKWISPNDNILITDDQITLTKSGDGSMSLQISNVSLSQAGTYKCQVCSDKETVSSSCNLKVMPGVLPKPKRRIASSVGHDVPSKLSEDVKENETILWLTQQANEVTISSSNWTKPLCWSCGFDQKYDLLEVICRGKLFTFRKCVNKRSKKEFTSKSYNKFFKTSSAALNEAFLSNSCHHPSITRAQEIYETSNSFIILFPLLSLNTRLFEYVSHLYSFDVLQALHLVAHLFDALSYLHGRNIACLAINPQNLIVDCSLPSNPLLKLIDFGSAHQLDSTSCNSYVHPFNDDPEFTPPEVLHHLPITCHADVWNAAVVLYALLSGTTPFYKNQMEDCCQNVVDLKYEFPQHLFQEISPLVISFISTIFVMPPRPNAQICIEQVNLLKSISKKTTIPRSLLLGFIERRQNMEI